MYTQAVHKFPKQLDIKNERSADLLTDLLKRLILETELRLNINPKN